MRKRKQIIIWVLAFIILTSPMLVSAEDSTDVYYNQSESDMGISLKSLEVSGGLVAFLERYHPSLGGNLSAHLVTVSDIIQLGVGTGIWASSYDHYGWENEDDDEKVSCMYLLGKLRLAPDVEVLDVKPFIEGAVGVNFYNYSYGKIAGDRNEVYSESEVKPAIRFVAGCLYELPLGKRNISLLLREEIDPYQIEAWHIYIGASINLQKD